MFLLISACTLSGVTEFISSFNTFLNLILPEENVVEIIKVVDNNNNKWYEVDYLAQDKIAKETFLIKIK